MPTTAERHALLFLAAIAIIGGGVRSAGSARFAREFGGGKRAPGAGANASVADRALGAQIAAIDSARAARSNRSPRGARPRTPRKETADGRSSSEAQVPRISNRNASERQPLLVDINRATQAELERLPRVGPALAGRIIAWREQHGPYRSIDDLRHVRGIGAATAALLAPVVTF